MHPVDMYCVLHELQLMQESSSSFIHRSSDGLCRVLEPCFQGQAGPDRQVYGEEEGCGTQEGMTTPGSF